MKSCTIRRAKKEDCETIAAILYRAFAPYEHQYTTEGFERTVLNAGQLAERLHEVVTLVALWEGTIAGTVGMQETASGVYIQSMAVDPAAQGHGIAFALLNDIETSARQAGKERLYLSTTPFLLPAIALYERFGFTIVPDSDHDLAGTPLIAMEKWLQK
ncbi:MAG: GNAT family N-acetyltransferase [Saprospiraceae bacterium]|nr:GNAT family N-acetyltransferase [Saprospiraceae bacterium]